MRDSLETKFRRNTRQRVYHVSLHALHSLLFIFVDIYMHFLALCAVDIEHEFLFSVFHEAPCSAETLLRSIESYVIYVHRAFLVNAIKIDMLEALRLHWRIHIDTYMALCQ